MKKFIKTLVILLVTLCIFTSCSKKSDAGTSDKKESSKSLRFVTGGESGTYYAFGSVLAQHATNNTPYRITGLVGAGSRGNVLEIQDRNADLGFCQTDVLAYAYNGTNLFAKDGKVDSIKTVAALYPEPVQVISVNPQIKSIADLKGKRVSIGSAGSGVYFNAMDFLNAYGMTEKDIVPTYQSFGDSASDLKDGKIDAAFIVAGAPTTAVVDLSTTRDVNIISIDDEHINTLVQKSPFYTKYIIPASVYKTDSDITTLAVGAVVVAHESISDDAIYAFTKDMFDDPASLVNTHAKYNELNLDFATSVTTVPYHPGAAKYFAEKGYKVETK
ncbi:MAG: TAXI family TRAP transporter solute-binding subunit [Sphaerochaetaceae bacterium]|nr:TAXI family TRAP transporter solute-binding subunit [Spirochaetales bacterium]MDY5968139.1 TAXI family TRAP transporter solute-binding subunit [Sphaerochaetaceae bacterium]